MNALEVCFIVCSFTNVVN